MPISLTSSATIRGSLTTPRDGGSASFEVDARSVKSVGNGTDVDQASAVYFDDFTIAASGTLDIDLSGSLTDAHGNVLVFTAIKEIMVIAGAANANTIVVGNGGVNSFIGPFGAAAHTLAVGPADRADLTNYSAAGWPVVAGTGDILRLANGGAGTAVTGRIVIVGEV